MALNMIKLVVGCDTIEDLLAWHQSGRPWIMHTRQTPKRAAELLDGGSLYRVFKGAILCRQRILVEGIGQFQAAFGCGDIGQLHAGFHRAPATAALACQLVHRIGLCRINQHDRRGRRIGIEVELTDRWQRLCRSTPCRCQGKAKQQPEQVFLDAHHYSPCKQKTSRCH